MSLSLHVCRRGDILLLLSVCTVADAERRKDAAQIRSLLDAADSRPHGPTSNQNSGNNHTAAGRQPAAQAAAVTDVSVAALAVAVGRFAVWAPYWDSGDGAEAAAATARQPPPGASAGARRSLPSLQLRGRLSAFLDNAMGGPGRLARAVAERRRQRQQLPREQQAVNGADTDALLRVADTWANVCRRLPWLCVGARVPGAVLLHGSLSLPGRAHAAWRRRPGGGASSPLERRRGAALTAAHRRLVSINRSRFLCFFSRSTSLCAS